MREQRKMIPHINPPIIDTFSGVAGHVSVLMLNEINKYLIFKNHYLISYNKDLKAPGFNWLYYDDAFRISYDIGDLIMSVGICEAVKTCIDAGYYVHIFLDHFHLPFTREYQQKHKIHDCANVMGYDDEKKCFFVGDNYNGGRYEIAEIAYTDFEDARKNIPQTTAEKCQVKTDEGIVDEKWILLLLKSYIDKACYLPTEKMNTVHLNLLGEEVVYGIAIYDVLLWHVERCNSAYEPDIRSFHILVNHMNLYVYLCDLLELDAEFYDGANQLIKKAMINRNAFLKYSKTYRGKEKLLDAIHKLKDEEKQYINEVIKYLVDKQ